VADQALKRVCLLTGASGRLGRAFCAQHAQRYAIVAVYRTTPPDAPSQDMTLVDPLQLRAELPENAHPVYAVRADLEDDAEVERVVEIALARFDRIDLIVHAATAFKPDSLLEPRGYFENFDRQIRLNTRVPLMLAMAACERFWRTRYDENVAARRHILNVSSTSGLSVFPDQGQSAYSAAKAALNFATSHLAHEFRRIGVRVNALAPTRFPGKVPTEAVADAIAHIDDSPLTGKIIRFEREGQALQ
jgi:NAD(P)-dependent dehydrogenase (short-subunit alcohol dehydrogenase family)